MSALWRDLIPLILVSAVLPLQTIVTLALVRSSIRSAYAWVAGMCLVRVLQGVLFGFVIGGGSSRMMRHRRSISWRRCSLFWR
jgi:NhaP-type Na+/H+ or K+/H+ antiporter